MLKKIRLDKLVQLKLPNISRTQIVDLIANGLVMVDGKAVTKPGAVFNLGVSITCDAQEQKYVSRAGYKLEQALNIFEIMLTNKVALDAGLSTGGFTDCLLQHGVARVYGVDVGTNQVHAKIKKDERVHVLEQTNLRYLDLLPELVDIVTLDLSFISLLKIIPNIPKFLKPQGKLIVLIKPQFEVGKDQIGASGVVRDSKIRAQVVQRVVDGIVSNGFIFKRLIDSPVTGADGNYEFLAYFIASSSIS